MRSRVAIVAALAIIAAATLVPVGSGGGVSGLCIFCGDRGLADFLLNITLFVPLGAGLAAAGWPGWRTIAVAAVVTFGVEVVQVGLVPGRDANAGDLLSNTIGGAVGWLLLRSLQRLLELDPRWAKLLPPVAAAAVMGLLLLGQWLLTPSFPPTTYYLQWTADFGNMETYRGRVLTSRVGPLLLPGPPGRLERSDSVRTLLRQGAGMGAVLRAGPPPDGLAPVVSIYDDRQKEIVLLGASENDLVYRFRMIADEVRLDGADVSFDGALQGMVAGEVVEVGVNRRGAEWCASVGRRSVCVPGFTAGDTRMLLYYRPDWRGTTREIIGLLWLAALFVPVGLVGRSWVARGAGAAVAAVGLTALPAVLGFTGSPLIEVLAGLGGIGLGGLFVDTLTGRNSLPE